MAELDSQSLARKSGPSISAQDQALDDGLDRLARTTGKSEVHSQFGDWSKDHTVNIRLSIPLLPDRFYVTLVMGRERRSPQRRAAERQKHPLKTTGNVAFLFVAGTTVGFALFTLVQVVGLSVLSKTGWITP
jgi:hypothetical protein